MIEDLLTIYSVDVGLTDEQAQEIYIRMLANPVWRSRISAEINLAFADTDLSWAILLEKAEIYSEGSELEARNYAEKLILLPLKSVESLL